MSSRATVVRRSGNDRRSDGCLEKTPYEWLDIAALRDSSFPDDDIRHVRYFTALVKSLLDDLDRTDRRQVCLKAPRTLPGV